MFNAASQARFPKTVSRYAGAVALTALCSQVLRLVPISVA